MPLAGCRWAFGPFTCRQSRLKTGSDRCDGRLDTRKIPPWFHADDAAAIGAPKSTQKQCLAKTIEESRNKAMPPQPLRLTARAAIRLGPLKIAALDKNLVEFCANGKYHLISLLRAPKAPGCWVRRSANRRTLFLKKMGLPPGGPFNSKIFSLLSIIVKIKRGLVPLFVGTYNRGPEVLPD